MKSLLIFIFSLFFLLSHSLSQTCCSGGIPLSGNIGLPAEAKGSFQLGVYYDYNSLHALYAGNSKLNDNSRNRVTHSALINIGYTISKSLAVEGLFSWVNQRRLIEQFEQSNLSQTKGIGDGIILVKYHLQNLSKYNIALHFGVGAKLPLGSSTKSNDLGFQYNADLQPGSGAWDLILWNSLFFPFISLRPSTNIFVNTSYRYTGQNSKYLGSEKYRFGNELQIKAGISDRFFFLKRLFNISMSLKYRNALKDIFNDNKLENTGGNWLFLAPGISLLITNNISGNINVEFPVYSHVEGTQLTPSFRLNFGLLIKFQGKKNIFTNFKL